VSPQAFFRGSPPYAGIWGLGMDGAAAPFVNDAKGGKMVPAEPFLTTLWMAKQLASEAFALQFCGFGAGRHGWLTLGGYLTTQVSSGGGGGHCCTYHRTRSARGTPIGWLKRLDRWAWLIGRGLRRLVCDRWRAGARA